MTKYIFITGGVISSIGKGITTSSIAMLLKERGYKVSIRKMDPYINIDSGTMSPYQHGETYVTDDGVETDLDLGHYERFTGILCNRFSNFTTGKIYNSVIKKEREGLFLGETVQIIPHITNEIKESISLNSDIADIVIIEIGGTVGDIESLPFLEAVRQFKYENGEKDVLFVHITLIPCIKSVKELKTKPTQQSVATLRAIGIIPDILICRSECKLSDDHFNKLSLFCSISKSEIFEEIDVNTSVYEVPIELEKQGLDTLILRKLSLEVNNIDLSNWNRMLESIRYSYRNRKNNSIKIAVVGKYVKLKDAYYSVYEAIYHGGIINNVFIDIKIIESDEINESSVSNLLFDVDAILIPGGFGSRGIIGKLTAIRYAREHNIPFFGICLGFQCAIIEFARNVCGLSEANSIEFDYDTQDPVICFLKNQSIDMQKGGTMKLGSFPISLNNNESIAFKAYNKKEINERHRHRYEFNRDYENMFIDNGFIMSGIASRNNEVTVEIIELIKHPWFVACQFHPEFKSMPLKPHPLFNSFVNAAIKYHYNRK